MKAYLHLIKYALSKGLFIKVNCEGTQLICLTSDYSEIMTAIDSVKESSIRVCRYDQCIASAQINTGSAPGETIADYSESSFMDEWQMKY